MDCFGLTYSTIDITEAAAALKLTYVGTRVTKYALLPNIDEVNRDREIMIGSSINTEL